MSDLAGRLKILGSWSPLAAPLALMGLQPTRQEATTEFLRSRSMGQIDWGAMIGQGLDVLSSIRTPRRGGGGAPAAGFMGIPTGGGMGSALAAATGAEMPRRRRRRGITARDLRSFRRVANLIRKYAAPVRHFRTRPRR